LIRELDDVSLAFSMWEQARKAVRDAEEKLLQIRKRRHTAQELAAIQDEIVQLRAKTDRLMDEAIAALRRHNATRKRPH
jgi:flagellin-like hook-associated protein FlgL